MAGKLTQAKAKKILRHGEVRGKKLTQRQRGFMGARASGSSHKSGHKSSHKKMGYG